MRWLEKIENRLEWLHFPGLPKYLAFLGVIAYACQWARPEIAQMLDFDRTKFLSGEVWRLFTFPFAPWGLKSFSPIGVLFLFFAVNIAILISDSLEEMWGTTRTTLYVLVSWLGMAVSHLVFAPGLPLSGFLMSTSLFLAFTTLFPRYEFRLFLILPVQVRFLGWFAFAGLVFTAAGNPVTLLLIVPALLPYALWVLPSFARDRAGLVEAASRRKKFVAAGLPEATAFHRCDTCGKTENDDRNLDFFTLPDGKEYCEEHLPPGS